MIIGLTGTYCSGKNYIAGFLKKRGLPVLDVDRLGHKAIETEKNLITSRFGNDILNADGTVSRKLLGEKVFGKPGELADLEGIIHPRVNLETDAWIKTHNGKPCVINAALLHRSSSFASFNALIIVRAPVLTRLLRAKKRDKLPWKEIIKRVYSQKNFLSQYFSKKADIYIVENPGFPYFGFRRSLKPEDRINEILSLLGLD